MADTGPTLGGERVRIVLGDLECDIVERWEIRRSFFNPPGSFAIRVGHSLLAGEILRRALPGTAFTLYIDLPDGRSVAIMTGRVDDPEPENGAGGTEVTIRGRDWMMPLVKGMPEVERTFGRITFRALVETLLRDAGIPDFALDYTNADNLLAVQGVPRFETRQVPKPPLLNAANQARLNKIASVMIGPVAQAIRLATAEREMIDVEVIAGYDVQSPLKLSPGTTRWSFLQEQLNRAGLFMFCGVDEKSYILTQPTTTQAPTWQINRRRGASWGVVDARRRNSTASRYARYLVYGRGGGKPDSGDPTRKQIAGSFTDEEMTGYGFSEVWSRVDPAAKSAKQAEYLARRKAAEDRRNSWTLGYTLRGMSWPIIGTADTRALWAPDAVADVRDEEYEIAAPLWISEVVMRSDATGGSTTDITLHRPGDLVFGDEVLPVRTTTRRGRTQ